MTHLVLLLVLVAVALRTGACPVMCTCHRYSYHCTGPNVTLEDDAHDVTLAEVDTQELSLLDLLQVRSLTVENSRLENLANVTLEGELEMLRLGRNRIVQLPEFNISTLRYLDLSGNEIETVGVEFRTLSNLEVLNLSANFLTVIDSGWFSGLGALKCLDLSANNLTQLEDESFEPLESLQYLNLSNNRLKILNERCFISLVKLQQLDVSLNRLIRVELGSLQLPSLARLLLAGNSKLGASKEPVLLVGTGQRLQTVDASNIGLEQVPAALTHSIRTLRLVGNLIKTVRCGDLDSYPLLQLLDFDSNGLEVIEDDALGRLDSLTILYLTNNNMSEIPKSLSERLKVLHLEHNQIQQVRTRDLQGLTSLEVLLLNDNKIRLIEADAFNQLTSLVTLDISRNPIKILEAGCLSGSMALQVLRLASIDVISPPKEVSFPLSSTEHLITLDLSGSPGLARQLLADTAALAASRQLQELDLSFTELEFIRSDLLHFLPQLRIFHIEGNRINCTQLEWLAAWMRRQDEPEYKKVTCVSPPELWGTLLIDLQPSEVTLTQPTTTQNPPIETEDYFDVEAFLQENKSEALPIANSSQGEMSRFTGRQEKLHPGIILAAAMLGVVVALALLGVRFAKRRRVASRLRQQDLEVSSLPGVTELW